MLGHENRGLCCGQLQGPVPQPGDDSYPSAGLAAQVAGCKGKIKLPYKQTKQDFSSELSKDKLSPDANLGTS